ncbi:MAG: succinylglutamate desuccinylase/aspartoacylase family protein [Clostridiales bacterium]
MIELAKFDYEELVKHRGTKTKGFLEVALKADGSMMKIPYVIAVGAEEGPTLLMDGGIHGDEVEGADAIARVFKEIDPQKLKGVYLGVPHLNLEAYSIGKRVASSIDYTAADMNRNMPGDDVNGNISSTVLAKYVKSFVRHADYWLTFHSGGNKLMLEPVACYTTPHLDKKFGDLTLKMARCFATPFIWRNDPGTTIDGDKSMRAMSDRNGIAYICLEMGGNVMFGKDREEMYRLCHDGILNLMNLIKMTDGPAPVFREDIIDVTVEYLHNTHGGKYHMVKYIGETAQKGEVLGYITDVFGDKIDECIAPYDGIVVGTWTPPVIQPREWCCIYGKLVQD